MAGGFVGISTPDWRRRIVSIAAPCLPTNGSGDCSGDIVLWCSMPSALYPKLVFLRDEARVSAGKHVIARSELVRFAGMQIGGFCQRDSFGSSSGRAAVGNILPPFCRQRAECGLATIRKIPQGAR